MFTLRNRTNTPLKADLGPAFGVVRLRAMGTTDVAGDWSAVVLNPSVKAWFDRRTIMLVGQAEAALPADPVPEAASEPEKRKPGRPRKP